MTLNAFLFGIVSIVLTLIVTGESELIITNFLLGLIAGELTSKGKRKK